MITLTINDRALRQALQALETAATDMTPAMRKIAGTLLSQTQQNFEEEGRPAWEPSLAAQERQGQTLQDSRRLYSSVSTVYDSRSAGVGTNLVYAAIHQFGGEAGRRHAVTLPARPYLPLTGDDGLQPEAERAVLDTIVRHLESAVR
ncbi:phage virion morphogenesis protein [Escherichia coli]|uniref:phage virion morphogenesis protein n=1 Tax=Escherichia coli TaxID=562 RepID=UPI0010DD9748|nr:phage virion morphogenesis protein [Escherichia coli]GDO99290.1 phage morphogenesis protein [Escherichia coli]